MPLNVLVYRAGQCYPTNDFYDNIPPVQHEEVLVETPFLYLSADIPAGFAWRLTGERLRW